MGLQSDRLQSLRCQQVVTATSGLAPVAAALQVMYPQGDAQLAGLHLLVQASQRHASAQMQMRVWIALQLQA